MQTQRDHGDATIGSQDGRGGTQRREAQRHVPVPSGDPGHRCDRAWAGAGVIHICRALLLWRQGAPLARPPDPVAHLSVPQVERP